MNDRSATLPFPTDAPEPAPFRVGYRRWLDGLRGIGVLVVLLCHVHIVRSGLGGLDLFFVLSGFLITCVLLEEWNATGGIRVFQFYLRRIVRLTPTFLAVLVGCYLYVRTFRPELLADHQMAILAAGCHLSNWPRQFPISMYSLSHTWSLSLQEQFYVIWPLALLGCLKIGMGRILMVGLVIAGIAAAATVRSCIYYSIADDPNFGDHVWRLYTGLDTRSDTLLVGCLVGLAASWNWLPRSKRAGQILGVMALASALAMIYLAVKIHIYDHRHFKGLFTVTAILSAIILVRMLVAPSKWELRFLEFGPLVAVGKISFTLYLVHFPVAYYIGLPLGWNHLGNTLLVIAASFAAAIVCHNAIERPCLRFKVRLRESGPKRGELVPIASEAVRTAA